MVNEIARVSSCDMTDRISSQKENGIGKSYQSSLIRVSENWSTRYHLDNLVRQNMQ